MSEFARWQWDDLGQWRDFAEQYQAEMEAAFQRRAPSVEIAIPPFGVFRMDIKRMEQVTVKGRNPGYVRDIRRQARRIEAGYFILGQEGEIFASDEAVDQIEAIPALEALARLLGRIVEDPEDFGRRSANLADEEFCSTLGDCEEAVDFLTERGFEEIEEGASRFLVFMQEDVSGLKEAMREVEARLARLQKDQKKVEKNGADEGVESNIVQEDYDVVESNAIIEAEPAAPSARPVEGVEASNSTAVDTSDACEEAGSPPRRRRSEDERTPGRRDRIDSGRSPLTSGEHRPLVVRLVLPGGEKRIVELERDSLEELLTQAVQASGLRLPLVRRQQEGEASNSTSSSASASVARPASGDLGLGAEPGVSLRVLGAELGCGDDGEEEAKLLVEDFEKTFVERLSGGLLRLQDLASVAPLLAWHRPELIKLLKGRFRSLLEGSSEAWCKAAGCRPEEELLFGRALLRRLYSDKPLEERIEVCKLLLPTEKKEAKTVLKVDRSTFVKSALEGLEKLSVHQLRRTFAVEFVGEVAEDHGGPRRDFFGNFGSRLVDELPKLWKKLPRGALVPVADVVAESTPKADRLDMDDVQSVYRACGRACGLATKTGDVIGEELAGFFLHQVTRDDSVSLEELQRQLSESDGAGDIRASKAILEQKLPDVGLQGLKLTRVITCTETEVELVPGGKDIPVTEDNKAEWLQLHLHNKLYGSLSKAADAFRQGLLDVLGGSRRTCPFLALLTPAELAKAWQGDAITDEHVRQWREVSAVSTEVETQAKWLWELLDSGDEAFRTLVLHFATGSRRLGAGGLQQFEVQPADGSDASLPRAMTCANMLQLPRYSSKEVLDSQLRKATELCDGFQVL